MKKIIFILLILIFILSGCISNNTVFSYNTKICTNDEFTLPDLKGKTKEEIIEIFKEYDVEVLFSFDNSRYYGKDGYNQFVKYQNNLPGDFYKIGKTIRIYISPLELPNIDISNFTFDRPLENKSFINDSYGIVTWTHSYADGDTTSFIDPITKIRFSVRFLNIDTPEVSHSSYDKGDPWGKEAQNFTIKRLENAKLIVVESESNTETAKDVYDRYLGYIWIDGICLNLELVKEAYTNYTGSSLTSKYHNIFDSVETKVMCTGRRFYGEYDPNYNY